MMAINNTIFEEKGQHLKQVGFTGTKNPEIQAPLTTLLLRYWLTNLFSALRTSSVITYSSISLSRLRSSSALITPSICRSTGFKRCLEWSFYFSPLRFVSIDIQCAVILIGRQSVKSFNEAPEFKVCSYFPGKNMTRGRLLRYLAKFSGVHGYAHKETSPTPSKTRHHKIYPAFARIWQEQGASLHQKAGIVQATPLCMLGLLFKYRFPSPSSAFSRLTQGRRDWCAQHWLLGVGLGCKGCLLPYTLLVFHQDGRAYEEGASLPIPPSREIACPIQPWPNGRNDRSGLVLKSGVICASLSSMVVNHASSWERSWEYCFEPGAEQYCIDMVVLGDQPNLPHHLEYNGPQLFSC